MISPAMLLLLTLLGNWSSRGRFSDPGSLELPEASKDFSIRAEDDAAGIFRTAVEGDMADSDLLPCLEEKEKEEEVNFCFVCCRRLLAMEVTRRSPPSSVTFSMRPLLPLCFPAVL